MQPSGAYGGAGSVFDELLCKAAIDFLRIVVQTRSSEGLAPLVYSLGPRLSQRLDTLCFPLESITNPVKDTLPPTADTFTIEPEISTCASISAGEKDVAKIGDHDGSVAPDPNDVSSEVLFFQVHKTRPHLSRTPQHAPRIEDSHAVGIVTCPIYELDRGAQRVSVLLEQAGGRALDDLLLLSAAGLAPPDLRTLHEWTSSELQYAFGFRFPQGLRDACQRVLKKLLAAQANTHEVKQVYTHFDNVETDGSDLTALLMLESHGVIARRLEDEHSVDWALTLKGRRELIAIVSLSSPKRALVPRTDIALKDMSVFELAFKLLDEGWTCHVRGVGVRRSKRGRRGGGNAEFCEAEDYMVGGDKTFWLKHNQLTLQANYMRALLSSQTISKPIPHFRPEEFYVALLEGRPYTKRATRGAFSIVGETSAPISSTKAQARKRPRRARAPGPANPIDEIELDSDNGGGAVDEEVQIESSEAESGPSSSSGASSASSSSSQSASARSDSSRKSSAGGRPPSEPEPSRPQAVAPMQGAHAPSGRGRQLETTQYWKSFKLTQVKDKSGQHNGWEALCYLHPGRPRCTRTLRFGPCGGSEACEQMLKWWCLQAPTASSRAEHQSLPRRGPPAGLPSLEALEELSQAE